MKKVLLLSIAIMFIAGTAVFAIDESTGTSNSTNTNTRGEQWKKTQEELKKKQEELKNKKQETKEERCNRIQERIENRINSFNENKERRVNAYNNMRERIDKLIDKAESKGYDVTKLRSDYQTLDEKIKKFASDYATYIAKLQESKNYACGNSEGQFKTKIQEARSLLLKAKQDAVDIKLFFRNTIIPDFKKLREQVVQNRNKEKEQGDTTQNTNTNQESEGTQDEVEVVQ